ncbi:GNAT family N-acetyltransferase [Longispora sp. K20-0274]|uniref:GNAT family N-acetyltransferase n=1 Tax=Longispora sp. K20-0274 TaxID=3088255 RepID=UPI00399C421E
MEPVILTDSAALLARDDSPYLRLVLAEEGPVTGYAHADALLVVSRRGDGQPRGQALGDPDTCAALLAYARAEGLLAAGNWFNGPRGVPVGFEGRVYEWDFLWTETAPPPAPDAPEVLLLDGPAHAAEIDAVLDLALPESSVRPADGRARGWFGIRVDGRLAAVAADESSPGFGLLSGIAVHPAHQGLGLGGALTAAATGTLLAEHGIAGLGVYSDNTRAAALYVRLGYRGCLARTAGRLASSDSRVRGAIPG